MSDWGNAAARLVCPRCAGVFRIGFACCPRDGTQLQPLTRDPLEGTLFARRYLIEQCIGEGGMGRVYRARHQNMGRRFAVKVLYGDVAADPETRSRFRREAEAASRLDHPNLVSVVDFDETPDGQLYLVMDYAEGVTLGALIAQAGPLPPARAARLTLQLAQGLAHAHAQKLVHRDFKADNVIVMQRPEGEVARIVDFGLAMPQDQVHGSPRLTTEGFVVGTPAYMAPEQSTGQPVDHRADLFSLGVVLYEMLAGRLPFDGNPVEIARMNLTAQPPPIGLRSPGVQPDSELEGLACWLMQKSPAARPQSAMEVASTLENRRLSALGVPMQRAGTGNDAFAAPGAGPGAGMMPGAVPMAGAGMHQAHNGQGPGQGAPDRTTRVGRWVVFGSLGAAMAGLLALVAIQGADGAAAPEVASAAGAARGDEAEAVAAAPTGGVAEDVAGEAVAADPTPDPSKPAPAPPPPPPDKAGTEPAAPERTLAATDSAVSGNRTDSGKAGDAPRRDPVPTRAPARTAGSGAGTTDNILGLVSEIRGQLEKLEGVDPDKAAELRKRYVPIRKQASALRKDPEKLADAIRTLKSIQRDIARAMNRSGGSRSSSRASGGDRGW